MPAIPSAFYALKTARIFTAGGVLLILGCLICIPWSSFFVSKISLQEALALPSRHHLLGTDQMGRDLLVRLHAALWNAVLPLWGLVIFGHGIGVALAALLVKAPELSNRAIIALVRGLQVAGTLAVSAPVGLLVLVLGICLEESGFLAFALGFALLISLKVAFNFKNAYDEDKHLGYWIAHAATGGDVLRRFLVYGVRERWSTRLTTSLGLHLQMALIAETSLSYLGFGIQEPQASVGNMLAAHFDLFLSGEDWIFHVLVGFLVLLTAAPSSLFLLARSCLQIILRYEKKAFCKMQKAASATTQDQ